MMTRSHVLMITLACLTLTAACSSIPRRLTSPQVELVQLQLVQASFEGQRFDVSIMLSNPNAVAIPVRLVEFDVRLGGEGLLEGQSAAPFTLPANGSYSVDLEVFSNLVSSVSRLMSFAQGPSNALDYELRGRLTLDVAMREPLAFYRRGQVPLQLMP